MTRPNPGVVVAVIVGWVLLLYLIPLGVGLAVGAVPLRLISTGIFFDQSETSMAGYRAILWAPIVAGILMGIAGILLRPSRWGIALGLVGSTFAGTLLIAGGGLGIGPAGTLLLGTDLRWIWRFCVVAGGLAVGFVGPLLLRTEAEDHQLDFKSLRRQILLTGLVLGALILVFAPGPILGKVMAGVGSWLGSLVWVLGL